MIKRLASKNETNWWKAKICRFFRSPKDAAFPLEFVVAATSQPPNQLISKEKAEYVTYSTYKE